MLVHQQIGLAILALALRAAADYLPDNSGGFPGQIGGFSFGGNPLWSSLCGQTLDDANATGVYDYNPHVSQFKQKGQPDNDSGQTLPVQWLATVEEVNGGQNGSVQWGVWYSPLGANYSYDWGLGYDVCAYVIEVTSIDFLYRAQNDNGDCTTAMDEECVSDLETQAKQLALGFTLDQSTGLPKANLTSNSTEAVCVDIGNALTDNFPKSCTNFMNTTEYIKVSGGALTGYSSSVLYDQCTITNSSSNNTYYHIENYDKYTFDNPPIQEKWYTALNWFTVPILTVFMPVANGKVPLSINHAAAKMQCIRATDVNEGSKIPAAAPKPTPISSGSSSLSGGAIAGIVVGVLTGVGLIAGALFFFWWKRRKQSKKLETFDPNSAEKNGAPPGYTATNDQVNERHLDTTQEQMKPAVEAADTPITELSPDNQVEKTGVDSKPAELEGEDASPIEKEAQQAPAELPASVPGGQR